MFDFVDESLGSRSAAPRTDLTGWKTAWARVRVSPAQRLTLFVLAAALAGALIVEPRVVVGGLIASALVLSTIHVGLRSVAWAIGVASPPTPAFQRSDPQLPIYSLIVPLHREANMIGALLAALSALDYPGSKLDVILAVEDDDSETRRVIGGAVLPPWVRVLVVPPGDLQTKPRACDYALAHVRGAFVVVFDAEDRPEPRQLREAVAAFDAHGPGVVCLQARLVPYNRSENWLTRLFTIDYLQWFDGMLTGFQRLGLPVPLGGTSNHFRGIM